MLSTSTQIKSKSQGISCLTAWGHLTHPIGSLKSRELSQRIKPKTHSCLPGEWPSMTVLWSINQELATTSKRISSRSSTVKSLNNKNWRPCGSSKKWYHMNQRSMHWIELISKQFRRCKCQRIGLCQTKKWMSSFQSLQTSTLSLIRFPLTITRCRSHPRWRDKRLRETRSRL